MQTEHSVAVRSALLEAVLATHSGTTLARLVGAGTCGMILDAWLVVSFPTVSWPVMPVRRPGPRCGSWCLPSACDCRGRCTVPRTER